MSDTCLHTPPLHSPPLRSTRLHSTPLHTPLNRTPLHSPPLHSTPLERVRFGAILVDPEARVLAASPVAQHILDTRDGLTTQSGRLVALSRNETALLHLMITAMHRSSVSSPARVCGVRIHRPRSKTPLEVVASPAAEHMQHPLSARATVIYVIDSDSPVETEPSPFAEKYSLTPAEARVATVVAKGNNGRVAARLLGVSYNTVKTHLKRIYAKTDTDGQSALLRLLLDARGTGKIAMTASLSSHPPG
jgi:DNA-binding CsgD family transcriptional regulator